jgi:hypothetical protein
MIYLRALFLLAVVAASFLLSLLGVDMEGVAYMAIVAIGLIFLTLED